MELYEFVKNPGLAPPAHHGFHQVRPCFHGDRILGGRRQGIVIRLDDVVRSCQLIPRFDGAVNRLWTTDNVLDLCLDFYVNNYLDRDSYHMLY